MRTKLSDLNIVLSVEEIHGMNATHNSVFRNVYTLNISEMCIE
jgi:hypothetical protein